MNTKSVETEIESKSENSSIRIRILMIIILLAGLFAIGRFTGIDQYFTGENVKQLIESTGYWGYVLYFILFTIGVLLQLPGLIFVAAGVYAYGKMIGLILGLIGGMVSLYINFIIVRKVGGEIFREIDKPWVKRILDKIDDHPIRTVAILRLFLIVSPRLNYMLALTSIRLKDYLIGSIIGLIWSITIFVLLIDWIVQYLSWL